MSCFNSFDKICRKIVCPTRHILDQSEMIQRKFKAKVLYQHLQIINQNQQILSTLVFPKDFQNLPTVLYLHGNGGHKLQSLQIAHGNFNLIAFDFRACGKSQGQFVTYGQQQVKDIACVIKAVKLKYNINKISIWGRSMGASLALMYASLNSTEINSMILDSPFRSLKKVVTNVAQHNKNNIPDLLINIAVYFVQKKVQQIAEKNVFQSDFKMHLNILKDIPIMFVYSTQDSVVKQEDVKQLYEAYRGQKHLIKIESLHHQDRPKYFIDQGIQFILDQSMNFGSKSNISSKKGLSLSTRTL